ncbi:hypothetical protein TD95_004601 [Thielaviopsis punctulata]|uniref:Glucose-methanol-choline oxidoreductase N-terminal domain-containing protein n=1 Tax=Thielaviopsis punctulata TaxID=72032 RepID=A0A0F4ZEH8_9PEZI|nr:hypothetical protein TD95_004601 [Thielaviopsis punctulata]
MAAKYFLTAALLAKAVLAENLDTYKDPLTGITFGRHVDSDSGFAFGLALPTKMGTDFIGQMTVPVTEGYGAVSLGGGMTNTLLVVAQPSGNTVVSSLRTATGYTNPSVLATNSTFQIMPIEKGVSVNGSSFTYTFLCKGCVTNDSMSWKTSATNAVIGWAMSNTALSSPSDPSTELNYHNGGFGLFGAPFANCTSSQFETWAAMSSSASSGSGNSTNGSLTPSAGAGKANLTTTVANETYDYIVAGGGIAGIITAERLAESGKSVLLIERGGKSLASTGGQAFMSWNSSVTQYDVPGLAYYLTSASQTNEYCTDTASMAGCILGGSGMVNAMMYVKPRMADYEKFPTGWKGSDMQKYADAVYKRTPGTTSPCANGKRYDQGAYDVVSKFLAGNGFKSIDAIADTEDKENVYTHPPWLIRDGLRGGPVRDYLPLAEAMKNFKLTLNTKVVRAIRTNSTITGVEVETSANQRQIINLNKGGAVVFSAGALSTPRLLFNSGIGPKEQIQIVQKGTTQVTLPKEDAWVELPVGQRIMDHPIFTVKLTTKSPLASLPSTAFTNPNSTNIDLFAQGSGLMAQSGQRINFWTSVTNSDKSVRYIQGTVNSPANNTIQMKIYLTHGLTSSGTLVINSAGATEFGVQPYLTTEGDKEAIKSFMNRLIKFTEASNSTLTMQGNNVTAESLTASWVTGSHYVSSAPLGSTSDEYSVVDMDTKVYGTDNLFISDASIHPDLPTGNTQAIVMVVAEKAAAAILAADKTTSTSKSASSGSSSGSGAGFATSTGAGSVATATASATSVVTTPSAVTSASAAPAATTSAGASKGSSGCRRRRAARRAALERASA